MEFLKAIKLANDLCRVTDCLNCPFHAGDCMRSFIILSQPERAEAILASFEKYPNDSEYIRKSVEY